MTITPNNGDLTAGIAGQYAESINPEAEALVTGDVPAVFSTDETILSGEDLEALTVVGFDGNGKIVPAVAADGGTPVQAIGVLVYAVDATGGDAPGHVYRGGMFNPDMLVWDASYDTDAEKATAFNGAPSPTQIVIRSITTFSV
ncbi:head decoration protein [Shimia sp.]|uniref:head decoration protein n=1 Tax=Shimia sp. TaxID=1954381 RepID=UPI00329A234A